MVLCIFQVPGNFDTVSHPAGRAKIRKNTAVVAPNEDLVNQQEFTLKPPVSRM